MPSRDKLDSQIVRRYRAGETLQRIGDALGFSAWGVWYRLKKLGVPRRSAGRPKGSTHELKLTLAQRERMLADLRAEKYESMQECADAYGISRDAVRQHARSAGLDVYSKRRRAARAKARLAELAQKRAKQREAQQKARMRTYRELSKLWIKGLTGEAVASRLGIPLSQVKAALIYCRKHHPALVPRRRAPRNSRRMSPP